MREEQSKQHKYLCHKNICLLWNKAVTFIYLLMLNILHTFIGLTFFLWPILVLLLMSMSQTFDWVFYGIIFTVGVLHQHTISTTQPFHHCLLWWRWCPITAYRHHYQTITDRLPYKKLVSNGLLLTISSTFWVGIIFELLH